MTRPARPATAADVATRAGVSRATVSHILNGREERFPEETRTRVRAAAEALDYRPSPAGRGLVTGRSDTIVVVMPETTIGQNLQNALERLGDDAAGMGSNVVLRFAGPDAERTATALLRLRPLAVVDFGSLDRAARNRLAAQGVPTVPDLTGARRGRLHEPQKEIAELQVAELTKRGDRQIIYASLSDRRPDPYGPGRYAGVAAACERRGLATPLSVPVPVDLEPAVKVLRELPSGVPLGVAAYNDQVALAILAAATRLRRTVPDDLTVVGVDATDVGQLWTPRLTTIAVDMGTFVNDVMVELAAALGRRMPRRRTEGGQMLQVVPGDTT
ncbi:LacI family DNA-binding transcriptional regulator [Streptomyces sp. NPDC085946]|uniref:LacI family DNA-binding transcriptional regulator n=1 Tax=Streptomyces sp. NPDC085946 TaxID=3365744 RepID=UPI0037CE34C8